MRIVHHRTREQVLIPDVRDLEVIPAAPLEHDVLLLVELLKDESNDARVGPSAQSDRAHVDDLRVVGHEQRVAVGKEHQIVPVGGIPVSAAEAVHDLIARG